MVLDYFYFAIAEIYFLNTQLCYNENTFRFLLIFLIAAAKIMKEFPKAISTYINGFAKAAGKFMKNSAKKWQQVAALEPVNMGTSDFR